MTKAEGEED